MDQIESVVRRHGNRSVIDEWSLVLSAASVAHRIVPADSGFALIVSSDDAQRALRLLSAYDVETRTKPPPPVEVPEYGPTWTGVLIAIALVAMHARTGTRSAASAWFERGAASAERILDGQWWRAVTALTLHADLAHVASNAAACAVFGTALMREVGPGVGLWILLLAGTGGNLLNALMRGSMHSAVGASTAIFGGLGALGALQLMRRRRTRSGWRAWTPFAAAIGLLAWLGTAPESDVVAHLLGFAVGAVLGALAALRAEPLRPVAQSALELAAVCAVGGCWWVALSAA